MKIKILKYLLGLFELFIIAGLGCVLFLGWHLYRGGIDFEFVTDLAGKALNPAESEYRISLEKAELTFAREPIPLAVKVHDAAVWDKNNHKIASVKELQLSLSLKALLTWRIAPASIVLYNPRIGVFIDKKGKIGVGFNAEGQQSDDDDSAADKDESFDFSTFDDVNLLTQVIDLEEGTFGAYSFLTSSDIQGGRLYFKDEKTGTFWIFKNVNISMRKKEQELTLSGDVDLLQPKNEPAFISLKAETSGNKFNLKADVQNFRLPPKVIKVLLAGTSFSMPLNGTLTATVDLDKRLGLESISERIEQVNFAFVGEKGMIITPQPLNVSYDVDGLVIDGEVKDGFKEVKLSQIAAKTESGSVVWGTAEIKNLEKVIKENSFAPLVMDFYLNGKNIHISNLKKYWPNVLGPHTYEWVRDNISDGNITKASFHLLFKSDEDGGIVAEKTDGTVNIENADVRYLETLPVVEDASGVLYLTKDDVRIIINKGASLGLKLYDSELYFYDIWEPQEQAKMTIKVKGDLLDALTILNKKPFEFINDLGLPLQDMKGTADTVLKLSFPLSKNLTVDKVKIDVTSSIQAERLNVSKDYFLTDTEVKLAITNKQLKASGKGSFKNTNIDFVWDEMFLGKNAGSSYQLNMILDDKARENMGFAFYPFDSSNLKGNVKAKIEYKNPYKGNGQGKIKLDLTDADLVNKIIGMYKPKGLPSTADFTITAKNGAITAVPYFDLKAGNDILIKGNVKSMKKGSPVYLTLDKIILPGTDMQVKVSISSDKIAVEAKGSSFNAESLFDLADGGGFSLGGQPMTLGINFATEEVWLSERGNLYDAYLNLFYDTAGKKDGSFRAKTITGKDVTAYIRPMPDGRAKLMLMSDDGGAVLKALGYTSHFKGGELRAYAYLTPNYELEGKLYMQDFKIVNAPMLSQMLQVASLTGVLGALQGEGLEFDQAVVPFTYKQDTWQIKDAIASGFSLGLTGDGYYKDGIIDAEGSIIPAYAVNSLFGKIPLIGSLFTSEQDGGLIAFKYYIDGPFNSPVIVVNPLSALAPGVMRKVFDSTPQDDEIYDRKTSEKESAE